jgi:hypothetical protein
MIDRDNVKNYNVKGKKDREHELEERDELNNHGELPIGGRTPLGMETPVVRIGGATSMHGPRSSYYGGGGTSPGFQTPNYWGPASQREFSEHRFEDLPASSPLSRTPILMNPSNTPLLPGFGIGGGLSTMSPLYTPLGVPGSASFHNSSMHRPSSSNVRSPSYLYQGSGSSSPNYSSLQSRSPDYNSPMGSSGRYNNSPNYSPSPMDRNQIFKDEENDSDEDDE